MITENPLISVVIPTYNHAHFLKEALESVQAQTYSHWEAIVVNNYSEDNTIEVVEGFVDPRIRLVNFRNHGIIAAARNEGIRQARGEYVAFLDSDDLWKPEKLIRCMERLLHGFDVVCHATIKQWKNGETHILIYGPEKRAQYKSLLYQGNCFATSATVVRKSILIKVKGFDENPEYVTAEDYDLWLRISKITKHISFIKEPLGAYRVHQENLSSIGTKLFNAECAVLDFHFSQEKKHGFIANLKKRKRYAITYYNQGVIFKKNGHVREAFIYFFQSLKRNCLLIESYIACVSLVLVFISRRLSCATRSDIV